MSVEQLLQIVGAVAAVELVIRGWKEWSAARRIVPIAGLNAVVIAEHECVPTEFAGSRHKSTRALLLMYGFLFVTPNRRKQAFRVQGVTGVRDGGEIAYTDIRAGDSLRVVLGDGERPNAFVKSLKGGGLGGYRTIAIRDLADSEMAERAYCVTVRTRGRYAPTSDNGRVPQWLQYDVLGSAPRSGFLHGSVALSDLPDDSMHVVLAAGGTCECEESQTSSRLASAVRCRMLRRSVNPWSALLHLVARCGIFLAMLRASGLVLSVTAPAPSVGFIAGVLLVYTLGVEFALANYVWRKIFEGQYRHPGNETEQSKLIVANSKEWMPTHLVNTTPPRLWTGATSHCMSAGRVVNGTDAKSILQHRWHRFSYLFNDFRRLYAWIVGNRSGRANCQ